MSQNPNGQTSDQEQMQAFIVAICLLAFAFFVITMMQEELSAFAGAMSYLHVLPAATLSEAFPALRDLPFVGPRFFVRAETVALFLEQGNFAYMSNPQRLEVLAVAGTCAMPIYLPFMLYAGTAGRRIRPDILYKTAYTLDHMIWTQSENWLTSRTARHVDPLKLDEVSAGYLARNVVERTESRPGKADHCGELVSLAPAAATPSPWHRALRPEEWLVAHGLSLDMKEIERAREREWSYPDALLEARGTWKDLSLDTLMEVLSEQLRSPWTGFASLRPCHRALAAVMCLFYAYDIKGGNALLEDLGAINDAIRARAGAMDAALEAEEGFMKRIDDILEGKPGKLMRDVAEKHAWVESAFPAMLAIARKDRGVLPAAAFLWLKAEDRRLWYILDNVGSEAVMVESAGAMAHYRAEHQIGRPIRRPAVYQAARAVLEDYLDMTPERIDARLDKEVRSRTAGQKIDLIYSGIDG